MQAITATIQKLLKEFDEFKLFYSVAELKLLKEIEELKLSNTKLKKNIQNLQNEFGLEICAYFHDCNSIRKTTEKYYFEDVRDCYEALVDYNGCSDPLYDADDFGDCYKEMFDKLDKEREEEAKIRQMVLIEGGEVGSESDESEKNEDSSELLI
jgi:hypothetical protein